MSPATATTRHRSRAGFTLMEILIAVGIFAIGFAMVAAIFPSAALLQKRAADDNAAEQAARTAEAFAAGRPLLEEELDDSNFGVVVDGPDTYTYAEWAAKTPRVLALPPAMLDPAASPAPTTLWSPFDRSMPTMALPLRARRFFWVPLFMDADASTDPQPPHDWRVYVFVMQGRQMAQYPKDTNTDANPDDPDSFPAVRYVAGSLAAGNASRFVFDTAGYNDDTDNDDIQDQLNPGDLILDNNGAVHQVADTIDPDGDWIEVTDVFQQTPAAIDGIWFSPPGEQRNNAGTPSGDTSPTRQILVLTEGVVK